MTQVTELVRNSYKWFRKYGAGKQFDTVRFVGGDTDKAWRKYRTTGLGGSDIAAIMGISPYRTALDVWLEKTGRQLPEDISSNEAVYWGTVNEANVADRYARDHPKCKVMRINATLVGDEDWKRANLDRMVIRPDGKPEVLEIKTASAYKASEWDAGVPAYYLTQVMWYLAITGWDMAHVAVLIGGNDYREYDVPRDEEDVKAVVNAASVFWNDYVQADVMPQVVGADVDSLASLMPQASDEYATPEDVDKAQHLIDLYMSASESAKQEKEVADDAKAKLCALIGDAKGIQTDTAQVTWNRGERRRFDSKRFRAECPELYDKYQTAGSFSQFRVKGE